MNNPEARHAFEVRIRERAAHLAGIFQEIGLECSAQVPPEINLRVYCLELAFGFISDALCHHCFPGLEEIRDSVMDEVRIEEGLIVPS